MKIEHILFVSDKNELPYYLKEYENITEILVINLFENPQKIRKDVISRLKYCNTKKLNTHISASYVIARRGMRFKEKLLKGQIPKIPENIKNSHEWKKWSYLNKLKTA